MEEIIISGKFDKKNPITICLLVIASLAFIVAVAFAYGCYSDPPSYTVQGWHRVLVYELDQSVLYYLFAGFKWTAAPYIFYGSCLFASIAYFFHLMLNRCSLTVTDKRVYGKASFGRRIDLPVNQISSVGIDILDSVAVATSSGKIKFWLLINKTEIHNAISELLINQQKTEAKTTVEVKSSNADELKKYKELFDSGVITQEEFDAKKKQLLGL